jgi:hypothetical protein
MKLQLNLMHLIFFIALATIVFLLWGAASRIYTFPHATSVSSLSSDETNSIRRNVSIANKAKQSEDSNLPDVQSTIKAQYSSLYQWPTVSGSPANREEMDQWSYARGFTSRLAGKEEEYKTYSLETLKTLANGGDIHAMEILAKNAESTEQQMALLEKAAVNGSISALLSMGIRVKGSGALAEHEGVLTPLEKRNLQLESMAYYEVIGLRGDEEMSQSGKRLITNIEKVAFTPAEQQQIKTRAQTIFKELQHQRTELGLGEFDNSVPDSVKKYVATLTLPAEQVKNSCDLPANKAECDRLLAAIKDR